MIRTSVMWPYWWMNFPEYEDHIIAGMSIHRQQVYSRYLTWLYRKGSFMNCRPPPLPPLLNELPADDRTDFLEELPSNVVGTDQTAGPG